MPGRPVVLAMASAGALAAAGALSGCARSGAPSAAPRRVIIATGVAGGVYQPLGEALAQLYNARIPGVQFEARSTPGSVFNVDAVESGQAQVAFAQADAAYSAYTRGMQGHPRPHSSLRAVGVLYTNALQVVARRGGAAGDIRRLNGRRVGIGPQGSNTELVAPIVLGAHGAAPAEARSLDFEQGAAALASGELDAAFFMASFPVDAISRANRAGGLRLLAVEPAAVLLIRDRHPFYRPIVIPRGTYAGQDADVHTLGVDNVLVCRAELDEELVHDLAEVLFGALPELAQVHAAAGSIDAERAPATPIRLHPGAARYFREREVFW